MNNDNVGLTIKFFSTSTTKELKNLNAESKTLQKNVRVLGNEIKYAFNSSPIIGFARIIKNITNTMINAGKAQTQYIENLHLLQTAYGEVGSSGEKLVKNMSTLSGLDMAELTKSLGQFRQLTNAMGLANDSANLLSENLLKMRNDISSLYNMEPSDVSRLLMSGLTGEAKSIKKLGADITSTALQQKAYNLGIEESITNMTQAEKVILRYLTIQEQLSNSQGDFANTINTVANQTKIWNAQLDILGRQLGSIFNAILKPMLPVLNGILMTINVLLGSLLGLFGIETEVTSISGGFDDLSASITSASEASKEANKSLRGFDKLNVIKTPTSSASGGGGLGGGINSKLLAQLKEYNDMLNKTNNKATEIRDKILGWFGYTKDANGEFKFSNKLIDKIKLAVVGLGIAFLVIYPVYKVLTNVFGLFKKNKSIKNTAKDLKDVGESTSVIKDGFSDMFKSLGKATEIIAILGGLALVIKEVSGLLKAFKESGLEVSDVLGLLASVLGSVAVAFTVISIAAKNMDIESILGVAVVLGGLVLVLGQVSDLLETMGQNGLTANDVVTTMVGIMGSLLLVMGGVALAGPSMTAGLIPFLAIVGGISAILLVMKATIPTILDALGTFITTIAPSVNEILKTIGDLIQKIIIDLGISLPPIINSVGNLFTSIFNGISRVIGTVGGTIIDILNTADNLNKNVLENILNFISRLGWSIDSFVSGAISSVTKLINFIVSGVEYLINLVIVKPINALLNQVKKNKIAELLGVDKKINLLGNVTISRFKPQLYEEGGFPTKGDMFIANEKAPEYVGSINNKPAVANNDQIVDGISTGVARALYGMKQTKQSIVIEATGDTQGLLDFIHFKEKEEDRQYGL